MRSRWSLSAGVLDAGLASLATFAAGIFAIRVLEPATLGSYALVFAAFNLATHIPRELIFVPAEVAAVTHPRPYRLLLLPRTLRLGVLPALCSGLLVSLWSFAGPASTPTAVVVALTTTAVVCAFLSPVQDHVRRMLHIGGEHRLAAFVSIVQVVGTIGVLLYGVRAGVPAAWIPFGSLAAANLFSLVAGWIVLRWRVEVPQELSAAPGFRELLGSGWWLLVGASFAPASVFIASVFVSHLAGPEALGYAEAARIVIRPLPVLAMGIAAVLRPLSIEAAQKRQLPLARRASKLYLRLMGLSGLLYLGVAGFDVGWNPLAHLLPAAYVISGLAAASILAEVFTVVLFPYRYELLGAGRVVTLTWIEGIGGGLRSLMGLTAGSLHAFALPLGLVAAAAVRFVAYRRALSQVYGEAAPIRRQERVSLTEPPVPMAIPAHPRPVGDR